jgi:hypothetical protein
MERPVRCRRLNLCLREMQNLHNAMRILPLAGTGYGPVRDSRLLARS